MMNPLRVARYLGADDTVGITIPLAAVDTADCVIVQLFYVQRTGAGAVMGQTA